MNEKSIKTRSDQYNAVTNKTQGYQEIYNSAANWHVIQGYLKAGKAKDLNAEAKKTGPCIITGSGPTLDDHIHKLVNWKGGIICHYSQAVSLMRFGVEPDYIVALDAICNWEGLQCIDWAKTKTKLVSHPGMWPSLIENWPNEILLYRENIGKKDGFTKHTQNVMFCERHGTLEEALASKIRFEPQIKTEITMFACTPPCQLIVAQILGYKMCFLVGLDFAYPGDKYRFSDWVYEGDMWTQRAYPIDKDKEYVLTNNNVKTEPLHLFYKKNFISAWRLSLMQCYNIPGGGVTEIPEANIDKVIKTTGRAYKPIPGELIIKKSERYLATIGCFVIDYDKGHGFVEADDLKTLENYMVYQNRIYVCDSCEAEALANVEKDHTGQPCQKCGVGKMVRVNRIDVEKNIKRLKALIDYAEAVK